MVQQEVSVLLGDEAGNLHMLHGDIKEEREVCVVALDLFLEVYPLAPTYRNLCQGFVVNMEFLHLLQYEGRANHVILASSVSTRKLSPGVCRSEIISLVLL